MEASDVIKVSRSFIVKAFEDGFLLGGEERQRLLRERPWSIPKKYLSWKTISIFAALGEVLLDQVLRGQVDPPLLGEDKDEYVSWMIDQYWGWWVKGNSPIFLVKKHVCEKLSKPSYGDKIKSIKDFVPFQGALLLFEKGILASGGDYLDYLLIGVGEDSLSYCAISPKGEKWYGDVQYDDWGKSKYDESNFHDQLRNITANVVTQVTAMVIAGGNKPRSAPPGKGKKAKRAKPGFWHPLELDARTRRGRMGGKLPSPHLRRGYERNQRYGKGNAFTKKVWIDPTPVGYNRGVK